MDEPMDRTPDFPQEDQTAVFDRVWRRVMAGGEAACPITWETPGPAAAPEGREPRPSLPAPRSGDRPQGDFPRREGAWVLGEGALDCGELLQELIRAALADWREYQALARRSGGAPGRTLAALAGEKRRHARRLSAAYFLISGVRYWPEGGTPPAPTAYLGALRRRFGLEQARMAACLSGAELTADPCLAQLLLELARSCWDCACRIRSLVEQA